MDVVLEAIKMYQKNRKRKMKELFHYAKICRVDKVMTPYLEAIT
jgi:hypothetical protein